MAGGGDSRTSLNLLCRLRQNPTDQSAWGQFVDRYGRMIYRWCRQWGLQEADAQDVTQNVLLDLAEQMRTFVYDRNGSFRGWLKTIAYRSWCRFVDNRKRIRASNSDQDNLARLYGDDASEDFLRQLERESNRELLEMAMELVRLRVQPHTWEAFRLTALDELSGAEVAERLQMKIGTVFVARSKVQKMLQEEIQRLDAGEPN